MNQAHFHIMIAHIPVIGIAIASVFLFISLFIKNESIRRFVFWYTLLISISVIPVILSGEGAEKVIEKLKLADENLIDRHEDFAKYPTIFSILLAVLSGVFLIWKRFSNMIVTLLLIISLTASGLLFLLSNRGGEIRHSEIRTTNTQAIQNKLMKDKKKSRYKHKDHSRDHD